MNLFLNSDDGSFYQIKFMYCSWIITLLKTNLLSEISVFQAQPAFICLNSAIPTVEQSAKYV